MIKYLAAILGFYAIIKYVIWCNLSYALYAIDESFVVPQYYNDIVNLVLYSSLAVSFFAIGKSEKDIIDRLFIYYAIAEFWALLSIQIGINLILPEARLFKMYIVAFLGILIVNFVLALYYLIVWFLKSR
jgi:hypothetical protein